MLHKLHDFLKKIYLYIVIYMHVINSAGNVSLIFSTEIQLYIMYKIKIKNTYLKLFF